MLNPKHDPGTGSLRQFSRRHLLWTLLAGATAIGLGQPRVAYAYAVDIRPSAPEQGDTIVVTYYNAPQRELLEQTFANTPARLQQEGVDPRVPWLLDFKLDFRFR